MLRLTTPLILLRKSVDVFRSTRITVCSRLFTSNDNGEKPETFNQKLREYPELHRDFKKLGLNKEVYAKVRGVPELYKLLRAGGRIRAQRWLAARPDRAEENRRTRSLGFRRTRTTTTACGGRGYMIGLSDKTYRAKVPGYESICHGSCIDRCSIPRELCIIVKDATSSVTIRTRRDM